MAILRTGFVAILLVCAASASRPLESARDQYRAHEDVPHPPQLLSKATDQAADVQQTLGAAPFIQSRHGKESGVYGQLHPPPAKHQAEPERKTANEQSNPQQNLRTQSAEELRQRRSIDSSGLFNLGTHYYNPWAPSVSAIVQVPPLSTFSIWQPQYYQIKRPYFVPVWGSPDRIPLYFPPQPLYVNPGYPVDNPPNNGYLPPDPNKQYLPPATNAVTSAPDNSTEMPLIDKFGDGPVWDSVTTTSTVAPTRRTRPPGQRTTTHPPLVHSNDSSGSGGNQLATATTARTTSARSVQRPPASGQSQPSDGRQPSRCVWAIVSCCSTSSEEVSYRCFEQLGCSGAFWDSSPCESDFARAAIANVMNYYNAK